MALGAPVVPPARRVRLARLERLERLARLEQRVQLVRRVRLEARDPLEHLVRRARREPLGRLERLDPRDPLESLTIARLLGHCVLATGGRFKMKAVLLCSATLKAPATIAMQCSLIRALARTSRQD